MEGIEGVVHSLATQLGVTAEVIIFLFCLFSSIPLAALTRLIPSASARALYSILSGAALCYFAYGGIYASIRLWAPTLIAFAIITASPRNCGYIVYVAAFAYLIFCHGVSLSGDAWRQGGIDFTGTLMVFTLKLVGCAMDVQDGRRVKGEEANKRMYANRLETLPSLLEFLGFVFFPGAVLVGPVFDLKSYRAYIRQEGVWARGGGNKGPPSTLPQAGISAVKVIITLVGYQYLSATFPGAFLGKEAFFQMTFARRWLYCVAAGFAFRWMYYFIWSVAEVAMVLSEFGYSGPSDHDPLWSRAINGNLVKVEFTASTSQMPAFWNIGVGRWLRTYVYERLTPPSGKPSVWTLIATQVVSALWHGLHPGYYLFFVNAAIAQHASKALYKLHVSIPEAKKGLRKMSHFGQLLFGRVAGSYATIAFIIVAPQPSPALRFTADVAHSAFKQLMINYANVGFMILRGDKTLAVWSSLYFIGTIIPILASALVPQITPRPKKKAA